MTNITINQLPAANSIDPTQDILPIYTHSVTATQGISRNTLLGLASAPVGLTDSQTLSAKTLTSPTINGATLSGTLSGTYTIGGTPTFPSSVTQNTATQTLTNKTLTSPTINSPTITNASITADSITGYTTSNNGSIYGISVSGGQITNAAIANATIGSAQIATNGIAAANLATSAITLGYMAVTSSKTTTSTTPVQLPGATVTVTIPSGGRSVKITAKPGHGMWSSNTGNAQLYFEIWDGTVGTGTMLDQKRDDRSGSLIGGSIAMAIVTPPAGSKTYNVAFCCSLAGTTTVEADPTYPAFILVEAI